MRTVALLVLFLFTGALDVSAQGPDLIVVGAGPGGLATALERSERQYVSPDEIALIYASLGETDQAFAWLNRAYEARSAFLITGIGSANYDPLRSDPRFDALLRKIGLRK